MSESIEMYLITLAALSETDGSQPVPLSRLASELAVQPVSVNQMVRKLEDAGLVQYLPYKGALLTSEGAAQACHVLRLRRLWETFFVEKLHLTISEADALACRMEHVTPDDVAARLESFLGNPRFSPQGKPIPGAAAPTPRLVPASQLGVGHQGIVAKIQTSAETEEFLNETGLRRGAQTCLLAKNAAGALLLQSPEGPVWLDPSIAENIFIEE